MDWERIFLNSAPFIAMFFLLVMIVITTCARRLEEYENLGVSRMQPVLFDYLDNPEIPSLNDIPTPVLYENTYVKNELAKAMKKILEGNSPASSPSVGDHQASTPDEEHIEDDGAYQSELDRLSFEFPVYDPDSGEYKSTP